MSVEDWARREAESIREAGGDIDGTEVARLDYDMEVDAFAAGIVHAFDALLSDEAVTAVFQNIDGLDTEYRLDEDEMRDRARAALQAAVDAVTKGEGG